MVLEISIVGFGLRLEFVFRLYVSLVWGFSAFVFENFHVFASFVFRRIKIYVSTLYIGLKFINKIKSSNEKRKKEKTVLLT